MARMLRRYFQMVAPGKRQGPASILVVDDNTDVREGLCDVLVEEGYCVRGAIDGGDALADVAANGAPDLVLLDLRMPKMDGYEFLQRQAASAKNIREVPVIVVSATLEKPLPHPVAAIFRKPVNLDQLLGAVRREVVKRYPAGIGAPRGGQS